MTDPLIPILDSADALLQRALRHVRFHCESDGRVAPARLDAHQLVIYEAALSTAELRAARCALDHATNGEDAIVRDCARAFAAEAVNGLAARLYARPADYGLSTRDIDLIRDHGVVTAASNSAFIDALGARIAERGAEQVLGDDLDEEKRLMRSTFRRFADEVVRPRAEAIHRKDLLVPDAILGGVRDLGCFGLSVPERFGGLLPDDGEDSLGMIVATEELSRGSLGAAGSLITRPEIMARALLEGGTERQKQRWLGAIASGDKLVAISVTEPNTGSDVASVALKAQRDGDGWRLSGGKTWCTFAGKADVMLVLARTDPDPALGHRGLSLFLVGLEINRTTLRAMRGRAALRTTSSTAWRAAGASRAAPLPPSATAACIRTRCTTTTSWYPTPTSLVRTAEWGGGSTSPCAALPVGVSRQRHAQPG